MPAPQFRHPCAGGFLRPALARSGERLPVEVLRGVSTGHANLRLVAFGGATMGPTWESLSESLMDEGGTPLSLAASVGACTCLVGRCAHIHLPCVTDDLDLDGDMTGVDPMGSANTQGGDDLDADMTGGGTIMF